MLDLATGCGRCHFEAVCSFEEGLIGAPHQPPARVEPLARLLGVTKGSFYWHFADRQALLDALLAQWERSATEEVIERVERASDEPAERLRELTRLVFRHGGPFDRAVRAWASHDRGAASVVARVNAGRYAFVRALLEAQGLDRHSAAMRSRLLYTSLVGEQPAISSPRVPRSKTPLPGKA